MTSTLAPKHRTTQIADDPARDRRRARLLTRAVIAYVVAVTGLVVFAGEGRVSEARLVHPAPGETYPINLFGVSDKTWLPVLMGLTALLVLGMIILFVRHYRRMGALHPGVGIFIGLSAIMLLDPVFNWAMYVTYNPRLFHFPTSWAYVSVSPTLEPFWVLGAYPFFWLAPGLALNALYRRFLIPRVRPGSWAARHPLAAVFSFGLVIGLVYDYLAEMFLMNAGIWVYWQNPAPVLRWGNGFMPLYEVVWVGLEMGVILALLHKNDGGRTLATKLSPRLRIAGRQLGEMATAGVMVFLLVFAHIAFFGVLRASGVSRTVTTRWQYPSVKVYDPDGRARAAGIPGPYFKGVLSGIPTAD